MYTNAKPSDRDENCDRRAAIVVGLQHWLRELDDLNLNLAAIRVAEAIVALEGEISAEPEGIE